MPQTWLIPSTRYPMHDNLCTKANMNPKPSFDELRSHLSGRPLVHFEPYRHSDSSMDASGFQTTNVASAAGVNGIDPNLLSPPLSVENLDTPPFKPADSDQASLSMKNRRRRRSRRHRDGMDRASTGNTDKKSSTPHIGRRRLGSTSVPDLRHAAGYQPFVSAAGQLLMRQQLQALHNAH